MESFGDQLQQVLEFREALPDVKRVPVAVEGVGDLVAVVAGAVALPQGLGAEHVGVAAVAGQREELISLDDVSGGRVTLGIGAGGSGFDATALGQEAWTPRERADRFGEFVPLLDRLLTESAVSQRGDFYAAEEARNLPGCVQRPRLPFAVAATGPRGLSLAARYGQAWVTTGDPKLYETGTPEQSVKAIGGQVERLGSACAAIGRSAAELDKVLLHGFTPDRNRPLESVDAFVDFAGRHRELGFTEIVIHWPIPDSDFAGDQTVFETIATEALAQLG
ncbi:LLM class flavin-dependent oxidoreductase [Streptomyces sp. NPDC057702]|uniref:LLM class flavin-dependent oxidoreductase n=1 Tax=unclassified Streptomyces TaxID=2593676 RepID=UPI0036C42A1F